MNRDVTGTISMANYFPIWTSSLLPRDVNFRVRPTQLWRSCLAVNGSRLMFKEQDVSYYVLLQGMSHSLEIHNCASRKLRHPAASLDRAVHVAVVGIESLKLPEC